MAAVARVQADVVGMSVSQCVWSIEEDFLRNKTHVTSAKQVESVCSCADLGLIWVGARIVWRRESRGFDYLWWLINSVLGPCKVAMEEAFDLSGPGGDKYQLATPAKSIKHPVGVTAMGRVGKKIIGQLRLGELPNTQLVTPTTQWIRCQTSNRKSHRGRCALDGCIG